MRTKERAFIILMSAGGVFVGFALAAFMISIMNPGSSSQLLTLSEQHDAGLMAARVDWLAGIIRPLGLVAAAIMLAGFALLLLNLNDHIGINLFRERTQALKLLAVAAATALLFSLLFALNIVEPVDSLLRLSGGGSTTTAMFIIKLLAAFLAGGLIWLVAAEAGWAGDFSSWEMPAQGNHREITAVFLLGGGAGLCGAVLYALNGWIFKNYYLLVSEVFDGSSEFSLAGINLITVELMLMTGLSLGILAGLVVVLSPAHRDWKARLHRLRFPGALFLVAAVIVLPFYFYAAAKYDLGKRDLAEAAGIERISKSSRTVLFVGRGRKAVAQRWYLYAAYYSPAGARTIEVSYEDLEKISGYLERRTAGSVFQYDAHDAVSRGYFVLWDVERALERQFTGAERMLSHRMTLLSRLRFLPVTAKNLSYLRDFADEAKWYAGEEAALNLAEAFIHFGKLPEARAWLRKAKERGAKRGALARITLPTGPVFRNGAIRGVITVNGTPLTGARVALFKDAFDAKKQTQSRVATGMLDARTLGRRGAFHFRNLGEGEYSVAIMSDRRTVPSDDASARVTISGLPRAVRINRANPVTDLGTMNIRVPR